MSEVDPLTVEELLGLVGNAVLERDIEFELTIHDKEPKQQKMTRRVVFRRLSYEEIDTLRKIPESEPLKYASIVIFSASQTPKFQNVDEVKKAPQGFVRHYSAVILAESGKDPFLGKR